MTFRKRPVEGAGSKRLVRLRATPNRLEQDVQRMHSDGKGEVKAYVVLALRPGNDVTVMTSDELKSTVQPLMRDWANSHLPRAHEYSGLIEDHDRAVAEAVPQTSKVNDSTTASPFALTQMPGEVMQTKLPRLMHASVAQTKEWIVNSPFQIDDDQSIAKTLLSCLFYLQQNTLKKIAKAWIKGICPRKQAKFPYRNKKGEDNGKEVKTPPWWTAENLCIFREPDHVDRWQRLALCLHFLRLRPSTEQLKKWNFEKTKEPIKTHTEHEWVAFLQELAPLSIVDDISPDDPGKAERRRRVMQKMYEIARLEEQYLDDAIDGDTLVQPLEVDLRKTIVRCGNKRSRQSSVASRSALEDDMSDCDDGVSPPVTKKSKAAVGTKTAAKATQPKPRSVTRGKPGRKIAATGLRGSSAKARHGDDSISERNPVVSSEERHAFPIPKHGAQMQPRMMGSEAATPLNISFNSSISDIGFDQPANTPMFPIAGGAPAMPGLPYQPQNYIQSGFQVQPVSQVPQPHFDTVPNTPTFLPHEILPFEQQTSQFSDHITVDIPAATRPQQYTRTQSYSTAQPMHGLPSNHRLSQYRQWPEDAPFIYAVPQGAQPTYAQHAGLAVDSGNAPASQGRATNPYHALPHTYDDEMSYDHPYYGPKHELPPPARLPDNIERGFTGHASGVGDSACPPGHGGHYFT